MRYSVRWTPEPLGPSSASNVTLAWLPSAACSTVAVETGGVPSILIAADFVASTFSTLSTERYSTAWFPASVTVNGPSYARQSPPSIRYSLRAMPEPAPSLAVRVAVTGDRYQPEVPSGLAGSSL